MMSDILAMHRHTPVLTAIDPRGLVVRAVGYCYENASVMHQARVSRTVQYHGGRANAQWDPRLILDATAPANLSTVHGLSGAALCTDSVDAGLRVSLYGEAGQQVYSWDGPGSQRWMHYDDQSRLNAMFEQAVEGEAVCTERLSYAASDQAFAIHNQCGRLIHHDDPAGALLFNDYGLTGAVLEQVRCLANERTAGYATLSRVNPLGELLSRTDAQGNEQHFSQTLDGLLHAVDLRLNNTVEHLPMVNAITYNAHGQVEKEIAGNGVVTTLEYAAEDGRLKRLLSRLAQNDPLQDLRYLYDPVGNVLSIEDAALPIRYFANQRIEPVSHYRYDTLYRLIEATGWEAGAVKHGPSSAASADPAMPGNYRQTYRYDDGNNLLELTHVGPQNPGHRLVAAAHSNRCLPVRDGIEPDEEDFRSGFDANGNLLKLQPGKTLIWDVRNQLREVRPVERDSGLDDCERYFYGADGMRVRKVRSLQTNAQTVFAKTLYLPGLEIRTHSGTGEELHVIEVATGRGSVRALHWESGKPTAITNNQQRYSLTDHLGSSTLELDSEGEVISQERYHPFGSTAWFAGRGEVEASYKTMRYSGKEREATGLYYYGFRHYVPSLQRWVNPDPAGEVDGLNFYLMVTNNPVNKIDPDGLKTFLFGVENEVENARKKSIKYIEEAIGILNDEQSDVLTNTMNDYFKDASPERVRQWKADLSEVRDVAKNTKIPRNVKLVGDCDDGGAYRKSVALLDMLKYEEFKKYTDSLDRVAKNYDGDKKALAEQIKEKKKNYKSERNNKFLLVNPKNWKVVKDQRGEVDVVLTMIHEFSHAALSTEDYAYKRILEGKDHAPLYDLAAGSLAPEAQLPALKSLIASGKKLNYSNVAYANADSFAAATVALVEVSRNRKKQNAAGSSH